MATVHGAHQLGPRYGQDDGGFFWPAGATMVPERLFRSGEMEVKPAVVDVFEEQDDIVVKAELPGIEKDNIEVTLTDHTLTIKGEKKKAEEVKEENYYRAERSYGSFLRTLELPREFA
jgi:HSP20 family molecular chaperone IbpA